MPNDEDKASENPYEALTAPTMHTPVQSVFQRSVFLALVPILPIAFAVLMFVANVRGIHTMRIFAILCIAICAPVAIKVSRRWCLVIVASQLLTS